MKYTALILFGFISLGVSGAESVTSNCNWKPKLPMTLNELQKNTEVPFHSSSNPSDEEFKVKVKGRTYFYSLPDKSCKSEIFIVNGDKLSAIDYYPDRGGGFTDFARVVYSSKSLKKQISGWVEMNNLCRLMQNGDCP